jgi:hypothetical protein
MGLHWSFLFFATFNLYIFIFTCVSIIFIVPCYYFDANMLYNYIVNEYCEISELIYLLFRTLTFANLFFAPFYFIDSWAVVSDGVHWGWIGMQLAWLTVVMSLLWLVHNYLLLHWSNKHIFFCICHPILHTDRKEPEHWTLKLNLYKYVFYRQ